jgi:hypothetical protein
MRHAITITALAALRLSLTSVVAAQNQPLAFEVANVKPSPPPPPGSIAPKKSIVLNRDQVLANHDGNKVW